MRSATCAKTMLRLIAFVLVGLVAAASVYYFSKIGPIYLFTSPGEMDIPIRNINGVLKADGLLRVPTTDIYSFYLEHRIAEHVADLNWSVPVRLTLARADASRNEMLLDSNFPHQELETLTGNEVSAAITSVSLERGSYDVRFVVLRPTQDVATLELRLNAHVRPR